MESCANCLYSGEGRFIKLGGDATPTDGIECRLHPPVPITEFERSMRRGEEMQETYWACPPVAEDHWCGQYSPPVRHS